MALHEGMDPVDMTVSAPPVPGPEVIGHIAGDIFQAFKDNGDVPDSADPKLTDLAKALAFAIVNEIKQHAKITITIEAGPPITATATIE